VWDVHLVWLQRTMYFHSSQSNKYYTLVLGFGKGWVAHWKARLSGSLQALNLIGHGIVVHPWFTRVKRLVLYTHQDSTNIREKK